VRVYGLFTPDALLVVAFTGMVTALIGALAALSQYDLKRILAYSTMSQLGLMILALGMGLADAALLHLLAHAFFKACLFLSAGMVIHSLQEGQPAHMAFDAQDVRNMGGLSKRMPVTFATFLASGASLAGVPFFSGFLSKEAILAGLMAQTSVLSWVMICVVLCVSFLTVMYTFRMIWFVFSGEERTTRVIAKREPHWVMRVPAVVLAMCSLWLLVSWNPFSFAGWLAQDNPTSSSLALTIFSVVWVAGAMVLSWSVFRKATFRTSALLRNSFYVDTLYRKVFAGVSGVTAVVVVYADKKGIDRALHGLAYTYVIFAHVIGWIDRTFVDGTVNATTRLTGFGGKITRSFQGGNIQLYIFWSALAIIIFIIWALK
jgi:NADH-quinone oxidoreductase subunit L